MTGSLSYQGDSLRLWQKKISVQLPKLLNLSQEDLQARYIYAKKDSYIKDDQSDPHWPSNGIKIYTVTFPGYDGYPISALLLIPSIKKFSKVPTVIYYHGHSASKEDAAFNQKHYLKGMGYQWAKQGYLVLVPTIRGFENNNKDHQKIALNLEKRGKHFLSTLALDALYAQDFLEKMPLSEWEIPLKIDTTRNSLVGVSLGGQLALLAGALDTRFETVSVHGAFFGYEILFSRHHHFCPK